MLTSTSFKLMYRTMSRKLFKTPYFKKRITCVTANTFHIRKVYYSSEQNVMQSKIPDIRIPNMFLEDYIWKNLHKWHDKTAVTCAETGRGYSFTEVYEKSNALANFLHKFPKLRQNDTVAVILPNVPEYAIVILGAIQAGLKVSPFNWMSTSDEITSQLLRAEVKLIFTSNELWPKINQAICKSNVTIPVVLVEQQSSQSTPRNVIKFNEILEGEHEVTFKIQRSMDNVILLPYSSGTTGLPKGVELTNRSIVSNLFQMGSDAFKLHCSTEGSDQEVVPAVLPLFHMYGLILVLFNLLSSGCKLVTVPNFGSQVFLKVLREHQPTFAYLVPPIVLFLANNSEVRPEHISQMRTILSGAAPLGPADIERLYKKSSGKVNILQGYGLTEASPLTHSQTTHIPNGVKMGSSGLALPNTECKVVCMDGTTKTGLGPNQSGELFIRGPQIMKGYYKNVEATRAVLDSEGWLRTGDIGHYDEDGHFFITDRLKELIKVGKKQAVELEDYPHHSVKGFQVAPAELEELLRDHPKIEDAAVVGVPHNEWGEVPKAFIVPKKNTSVRTSNIQEYIAAKVAKHKQLVGGIVITESIPKSASGKILRRILKNI